MATMGIRNLGAIYMCLNEYFAIRKLSVSCRVVVFPLKMPGTVDAPKITFSDTEFEEEFYSHDFGYIQELDGSQRQKLAAQTQAQTKKLRKEIKDLELYVRNAEKAAVKKGSEAPAETQPRDKQSTDGGDEDDMVTTTFTPPKWCVPIKANVIDFDFKALGQEVQFDVIMMDPPWQLATAAPTRGIALGYSQLNDEALQRCLELEHVQSDGFIFIWVINNRFAKAIEMMEKWGYEFIDTIDWVKQTVNRRLAKCHGFYLQHAKETCLVGRKGNPPQGWHRSAGSDIIWSERRGNSQKPDEIYELIEQLVPNGKYLEIFGRRNNLRDFWVTIGNEL
eukprot:Clim_evm86s157 gene=Clim_evmTU86s157